MGFELYIWGNQKFNAMDFQDLKKNFACVFSCIEFADMQDIDKDLKHKIILKLFHALEDEIRRFLNSLNVDYLLLNLSGDVFLRHNETRKIINIELYKPFTAQNVVQFFKNVLKASEEII